MSYARALLPALATIALSGSDKPQPRSIQPRWELHVRASNNDSDHLCFSEDGHGIVWFTNGDAGLVHVQRWSLPSGQPIPSKPFPVESRPQFDGTGDFVSGALNTARHEHSGALTWATPTAPLMDWGSGREFDFDTGTRSSIPGHPGRDESHSVGVEPGWLICNLHVERMGKGDPFTFSYAPEWAVIPLTGKISANFMVRLKWYASSVEAIAPDGSWVAADSSIEPNLPIPVRGQWLFHNEQTLRIWRAGNASPIHRIPLTHKVRSLSFSPHGHYLVVDYDSGDRELWDTGEGRLIGHLPKQMEVEWREDESGLSCVDGQARLHMLQVPSLQEQASLIVGNIEMGRFEGPIFSADLRFAAYWSREAIAGREGSDEAYAVKILVFDLVMQPGQEH